MRTNCEDISCAECFLLGDSVPDWPQRVVCRKLEQKLLSTMEDKGGICIDVESLEKKKTCEQLRF